MAFRSFAVLTLPARDTILGALSLDAGCRIEGVARRRLGKGPSAVELSFEVDGISADLAHGAASTLRDICGDWASVVSPASQHWMARCIVPLANVHSRSLRTLIGHRIAAAPAWFVAAGGLLQVHMAPAGGRPVGGLAMELENMLADMGIHWDVSIETVPAARYELAVHRLAETFPAPPAPKPGGSLERLMRWVPIENRA